MKKIIFKSLSNFENEPIVKFQREKSQATFLSDVLFARYSFIKKTANPQPGCATPVASNQRSRLATF